MTTSLPTLSSSSSSSSSSCLLAVMKGQRQSVENGVRSRPHGGLQSASQSRFEAGYSAAESPQSAAANQLFHPADQLCVEDDLELDRYPEDEEVEDEMTADSALHVHRRTASPADCTRKSNKPLMEKKRRQRINRCLNDLKTMVLEALKKDPSRYSKLEKADILEMTVRHLQALHRQDSACGRGRVLAGGEVSKYRAGFAQCAAEVSRYLAAMEGLPHDLHANVLNHLNAIASTVTSNVNTNATCVQNSVNVAPNPPPIIFVLNTAPPPGGGGGGGVSHIVPQPLSFQENAGNSMGAQPHVTLVTAKPTLQPLQQQQPLPQQPGGVQILPTRLSNGDLALVLPAMAPAPASVDDRRQPSAALQASSPVLTAILTSNRSHVSSSSSTSTASVVVQPPALSTSSEDSALGAEVLHDMSSDSDISSGVSTPLSSVSSAGSPLPSDEGGRASPRRSMASRASPTLKPQVWSSNQFREELSHPQHHQSLQHSCPPRSTPRRHPVLAPKPSYAPQRPPPQPEPPRPRKGVSPPREAPPQQSMWRPWH